MHCYSALVVAYSAVISAMENAAQWKLALAMLARMMCASGAQPNVVSFSAAISACEKCGQWMSATDLVSTMKDLHVQPNIVTINGVSAAFAKAGKWQKAHNLLTEAAGSKCETNIISYSSAILAYGQLSEWMGALSTFAALGQLRLKRSLFCVNSAIAACGKSWHQALNLASFAEERPDVVTCGALMNALAEGTEWELALTVLAEMHGSPDSACFSAGLGACEKAACWREGLQLLEDMAVARVLDEIACTLGISVCHKAGRWRDALGIFEDLANLQVRPSEANYGAALMACGEGGAWVSAIALLQDMMQKNFTPDCWAAGSAANAVRQGLGAEAANELLDKLRSRWQLTHSGMGSWELAAMIQAEMLKQATGIIAVAKPAGIRTEELVQGRVCLVSRLDHPTSGVLPLPLGSEGSLPAQWLQAQFAARLVDKEYLCLCEGPSLGAVGSTGKIDSPLQTTEVGHLGRQFSRTVVSQHGRPACTKFEVLETFAIRRGMEVMFLLAKPLTGRTHQIRVHLASIGRPLIGDLSYDESVLPGCPRLFLHCRQIQLRDLEGQPFVAECPLPLDLTNVLVQFRQQRRDKSCRRPLHVIEVGMFPLSQT
ncbi:unnamed protein product [Symbiodinium natans]|uniref:Pseudouridine synthase RsuA/RluA-like domain-containing protein n=1 Tax=Symbiodinium natans TaxID=878477 RepID=A0A812SCI6_9DINO|nr:unnamed protein product [Symbiodinium natans]